MGVSPGSHGTPSPGAPHPTVLARVPPRARREFTPSACIGTTPTAAPCLILTGGAFRVNRWSALLAPAHTVLVGRAWFDDSEQWFAVLPCARCEGEMITLPLMYIGRHDLSDAEMLVTDTHVTGMLNAEGALCGSGELGILTSGDEVRLIFRTDGDPGRLAFVLDFLACGSHLRKLRVEVPDPGGPLVVTEHLESDRGDVIPRWPS
jgi:hypothetical protein